MTAFLFLVLLVLAITVGLHLQHHHAKRLGRIAPTARDLPGFTRC